MAINFPTSPATNTPYPNVPTVPGVAYTFKNAAWYNYTGRANRENKFPNYAFQISQLNTPNADATNVSGLILADNFYAYYQTAVGVYRGQRVQVPTPRGGPHRLRLTINTADTAMGAGEWLAFGTNIEGIHLQDTLFGTSLARQMIVRFGFRGPAGVYNFNIRNDALTRSYMAPYTITAGQANTDLEFVIIIPPCTDGVWATDTAPHMWINWVMCNGNTTSAGNINKWVNGNFTAASGIGNGFATVGNVFELFDVGLHVDPYFTGLPPEWELPNWHDEYRRCQRYIQRIYSLRGIVTSATHGERCGATLPVPMRIIPALSIYGTPRVYDGVNTWPITAINGNYSSVNTVNCGLDFAAGASGNPRAFCQYYDSLYNYIRAIAWT